MTQKSQEWSLFIDDERFPVDDGSNWRIARNKTEALALIKEHGLPEHMAIDHDLGDGEPTGQDIMQALVALDLDGEIDLPHNPSYYVHSQNPVGRANIEALLGSYLKFKYG